jgi:hypothetical protein
MPCPFSLAPPQVTSQQGSERRPTPRSDGKQEGDETALTISIPLVALLGAVVFVAWRYMKLRVWQAVLCLLFGFFLAATTAAPAITHLVTALVQWLTSSKP